MENENGNGGAKREPRDLAAIVLDSDLANARRFVKYFGESLRYVPETGWFYWTGHHWRGGADLTAMEFAKDTAELIIEEAMSCKGQHRKTMFKWAKASQSAGSLSAMLKLSRSDSRLRIHLPEFDSDPMLLNCQNGVVDLRTGAKSPHKPEKLCSRISGATYGDALTDDSLWLSFLRDITGGDTALEQYLQRLAGYCLTGDIGEKCFFFCYGTGDNGKSVFIEVLYELLGTYSLALSTETLIKQRFGGGIPNDIARLCGPRLATVSETGKGEVWNEKLLKDLTGGDVVTARFLNKEFFDFRPQCKLLIRGNNKPEVKDFSTGLWRRMHLIPFEAQIAIDKQDKDLREKIIRRELSGVLTWALEGCINWRREGLNPPPCVIAAVEEYREEMDIIAIFLSDKTKHDPSGLLSVKATDLYLTYRKWAEDSGFPVMTQTAFGLEMNQRGLPRVRNKHGRVYTNLTLITSGDGE